MSYRAKMFMRTLILAAASPLFLARSLAREKGLVVMPPVGDEPELPPRALDKWTSETARCAIYLEYGSGGSTLTALARPNIRTVITVETDSAFLRNVEEKAPQREGFYPIHVNIGLTKAWGRPVIRFPTSSRLDRWDQYRETPWRILKTLQETPDLIFVDGRFRVACVLDAMLRLPDKADTVFLFDDFFGKRRHVYADALRFADNVSEHDRMAAFSKSVRMDRDLCARLLEDYRKVPE